MRHFTLLSTMAVVLMASLSMPVQALPFIPTTDPTSASTHWYQLQTSGIYIYYYPNQYDDIEAAATASTSDEYLWCFVGNESSGYKIYNRKAKGYLVLNMFVQNSPNASGIDYVETTSGNSFYIWCKMGTQKHYMCYDSSTGLFYGSNTKDDSYTVTEYEIPIQDVKGDLNRDEVVDISDLNILINVMLGLESNQKSDVNADGVTDVGDLNELINIILGKHTAMGNELTVYDSDNSNSNYPFAGHCADQEVVSRMIYPAASITQLKGKQLIRAMFYATSVCPQWGCDIQLSLKEVNRTNFLNSMDDSWADGGTPVTTLTNAGGSMYLDFVFDTPYTYQGGNLLVETKVVKTGVAQYAFFTYTQTSEPHSRIYLPDGGSSYTYALPKVTFTYK